MVVYYLLQGKQPHFYYIEILFQNNWNIQFKGTLHWVRAAALRIFRVPASVNIPLPDSITGVEKKQILKNVDIYRWISSLTVLRPSNLYLQTNRLRNRRHHSQSRKFLNSEICQHQISVKVFSFLLLMTCIWLRQVMVRSRGVPAPNLHPSKQMTSVFRSPALTAPAHMIGLQSCSVTFTTSINIGKLLV